MFKKNNGQAMIIITVCLLAILSLMALVFDTGRIFLEHSKLQRGVDASALAGAQSLPADDGSASLIEAEENATKAAELNNSPTENLTVDFAATTGAENNRKNMIIVTNEKTINTRMASLFGYPQWTIVTSAVARTGPISTINHWIPLAILDTNESIELYTHIRIGNTTHTQGKATDIMKNYIPIKYSSIRQDVANTIGSKASVGQKLSIDKNFNAENVCEGINDRIQGRLGVKGCFKVNENIDLSGLNIVGPGSRIDWAYGSDPRLVYIPFVKVVDNNYVEIVGFGLFYIEYAHYDPTPFGGNEPLTELVGYFVRTVSEGPIEDSSVDYGVVGIEYVDLNKLP